MTQQPSEPRVRIAKAEDAAAIAEIHVSAWQAAYRGLVPDAVLDGLSVRRHTGEWRHHLEQPTQGAWIDVIEDESIVGFALYEPSPDRDLDPRVDLELVALYVHPSRWRAGLGKRLLGAGLETARARAFGSMSLWVLLGNRRAQRFYQKLDFTRDGRRELRHIGGVDLPTVRMSRAW